LGLNNNNQHVRFICNMVILPHYKLEYYYYLLNVTDEDYDVSEHHIIKCTVHSTSSGPGTCPASAVWLMGVSVSTVEMSSSSPIEMSRHNPPLRKPDLTREVKNAIWMLHLAELLQQHWLPLVDEHNIT